jgi:hypothetical protein
MRQQQAPRPRGRQHEQGEKLERHQQAQQLLPRPSQADSRHLEDARMRGPRPPLGLDHLISLALVDGRIEAMADLQQGRGDLGTMCRQRPL